MRAHQDDVRSLEEQGPEILAPALGDASQNRSATRAVLMWHEAKPCTKVSSALECLTGADGRDDGGRDQQTDAGDAHEARTVGFLLADLIDLAGEVSFGMQNWL